MSESFEDSLHSSLGHGHPDLIPDEPDHDQGSGRSENREGGVFVLHHLGVLEGLEDIAGQVTNTSFFTLFFINYGLPLN